MMTTSETSTVQDRIKIIIAKVLETEPGLLGEDLSIEALGLDSLNLITINHLIEETFNITLSKYSFVELSSLERLIQIVAHEYEQSR
jgi:acyl carrier protein